VIDSIYNLINPFLILFYSLAGFPLLDFFLGTFFLSFLCVIVGEFTISLAIRFNRKFLTQMNEELQQMELLSLRAYEAGDKKSYRALNREANDIFGRKFFTMMAYSAGILWPTPFALGWLDLHFREIRFPLASPLSLIFGDTAGYLFIFILLYILARIIFKHLRPWLPYFRNVQKMLDRA
jgi:hypothetical protein